MVDEEQFGWAAAALRERHGVPQRGPGGAVLEALVGTVLSQNSTGSSARLAAQALRARFPNWEELLDAELGEIAEPIRGAGLAETRARRLKAIVARVVERFGEASLEALRAWPDAAAEAWLTALPGVGPKTAACVLLFALDREVFPVDTHVWRLAKRLGWIPDSLSRTEAYEVLREAVPAALRHELHVNLIRHGRTVCRAHRPACDGCPLAARCPSKVSAS